VWERAWNNLITWDLGPAFLVQDHQKTGRRIKKKNSTSNWFNEHKGPSMYLSIL
jgi:hypothetical protein